METNALATRHRPILPDPIVTALTENLTTLKKQHPQMILVDCTLGGGGHTHLLIQKIKALGLSDCVRVLGIDQDQDALTRAEERFKGEISENALVLHHGTFGDLKTALGAVEQKLGTKPVVVGLLADLGFSSDQIDDASRGLSFMHDGPLDMRLSQGRGESAYQRLSRVNIKELEDVIRDLGEERYWAKIARAICDARREHRLPKTTREFADLVTAQMPGSFVHSSRIHPATRVFQAIRIWVNDELGELERLLSPGILEIVQGGRAAFLTFHSLEDRRVKQAFKESAWRVLSKKPIEADEEELKANPRARSAKLRIAERIA